MRKLFATTVSLLASGLAAAHAGHGFTGPHWHASELVVPAVMLGCGAAAIWMWRKK